MNLEALRLISKGLRSMGIPVVIHNENTNINDYEKLNLLAVHKHLLIREIDFREDDIKKVFVNNSKKIHYCGESCSLSTNRHSRIDIDDELQNLLQEWVIIRSKGDTDFLFEDFEIFIKSIDRVTFVISIRPLMSVLDLKKKIEDARFYPVCEQRLIFNGKDLQDDKLICSYDIQEHSVIQVLFRLRGGKLYVLDPKDIAVEYDFIYPLSESIKHNRGGREFIRPVGWVKYGINVLGKHENDTWLLEDNHAWTVSYHGIIKEHKKSFLQNGHLRTPAIGACYGNGIYSSPNPNFVERYARSFTDNGNSYKFMFMNRVNMNHTKVKNNGYEFITYKDDYIRPYAFLIKKC